MQPMTEALVCLAIFLLCADFSFGIIFSKLIEMTEMLYIYNK